MVNCNQKICASCRYWSGQREFNFNNTTVRVLEEKGKCNGPLGSFKGIDVLSYSVCNKWQRF